MTEKVIKLTIVIGLPGSGKSHLMQQWLVDNPNGIGYDDFMDKFHTGELIEQLAGNTNVMINDPRLCFSSTFERCIKHFERLVSRQNMRLILFENNVEQCIENINKSNIVKNSEQRINDIKRLSCIYDVDGYVMEYSELYAIVIPVYKNMH